MIKLTKAQQDQLTAIGIGVVGVVAALWWFGVKSANHDLAVLRGKTAEMQKKVHDAESLMKQGDEIGEKLAARNELLTKRQGNLAPDRDAYAWLINTMNAFIQSRRGINIDSYSQPEITDGGLIPKFPYRWATFHLRGSGYYHDLGKFFADFENAYPYFQIKNPVLSINTGAAMEAEKLSVTFDLVAPVVVTPESK